ncbi:MAG: hypothetical protein Q9169_008192 [Polycauliona sp. 2 TL-2023]
MPIRTLLRASAPLHRLPSHRAGIATLPQNPHIYIFNDPNQKSHTLSLLPTTPPNTTLAIGSTTEIPATPASLKENAHFMDLLQNVIAQHASKDPDIRSLALAMASTGGANLGSVASLFPSQRQRQRHRSSSSSSTRYTKLSGGGGGGGGGDGAGGASSQGGAGSGGRGGHIHVYDYRHPPDYGRIPDPEDIFGSLEVDGEGGFVEGGGRYQGSGTYRLCTRDGM